MDKVIDKLLTLAREPSSWRGLVWVLTAAGISVSPEMAAQIGTAGMALAGLIGMFARDSGGRV